MTGQWVPPIVLIFGCLLQAADTTTCMDKAEATLTKQEYTEALVQLRECPDSSVSMYRIKGIAFHGLYIRDSAAYYLQRAYDHGSRDNDVLIRLAEALLWRGDSNAAGSVLDEVENKDDIPYKRVRALYHELTGRFQHALELYRDILDRKPEAHYIAYRRAQLLSWMKRLNESRASYTEFIHTSTIPTSARRKARVRRAEIMIWQGELRRALSELNQVIAEDSTHVRSHLLKARVLERMGKGGQARELYHLVLEIDPSNADATAALMKSETAREK